MTVYVAVRDFMEVPSEIIAVCVTEELAQEFVMDFMRKKWKENGKYGSLSDNYETAKDMFLAAECDSTMDINIYPYELRNAFNSPELNNF